MGSLPFFPTLDHTYIWTEWLHLFGSFELLEQFFSSLESDVIFESQGGEPMDVVAVSDFLHGLN